MNIERSRATRPSRGTRLPHPPQCAAHGRGAGAGLYRPGARHRRRAGGGLLPRHALSPDDPEWEGRDRFLLSNGHYAIALYAALIEAGFLPTEELETYGSDDSRLPMSGMASYTPGMEMSGGSLGHGLTIAVGRCLGLKRKGSDAFVYTLFSDGELDEGAIWEGLMSAAHWKLDNLIAMVDVNNQQADGPSSQVMAFEPLVEKLEAFGWYTQRIDGNDLDAVVAAFDNARNHPEATAADHRLRYAHGLRRAVPRSSARRTTSSASIRTNGSSRLHALEAGRQA